MSDTTPDSPPTAPSGKGLNRKVGGVSIKWLLLIGAVALVGAYLYRKYQANKNAATPAPVATATPLTPTTGGGSADYGPTAGNGVYSSAGGNNLVGQGYAYAGSLGSTTYSTSGTNTQWATNAANGLVGQGQYTALDIENALSNYITGAPLNTAQNAIVNAAIAAYGSPPEAVIPSTSAAVPAPQLPITPPGPLPLNDISGASHYYRTVAGDTPANLAYRFYGQTSLGSVIVNHNVDVPGVTADSVPVNVVLRIPLNPYDTTAPTGSANLPAGG